MAQYAAEGHTDFPDRLAEDSRKARIASRYRTAAQFRPEGVIVESAFPVGFRLYRLRDEKKQEVSLLGHQQRPLQASSEQALSEADTHSQRCANGRYDYAACSDEA